VPTYNEETVIGDMLENALEVDYPIDKMEILVVDSDSKDRTREIVEKYLIDSRVRLLSESRRGWNLAVKEACNQARGNVIVLSGADVLYHPDALKNLCIHFASVQIGAVAGRQVLLNENQTYATQLEAKYREWYHFMAQAESLIDQPFDVKGEIVAARKEIIRSILDRIGETATVDACIPFETRACGLRLIYEPKATYSERAPLGIRERLRVQIRRGRNLIQSTFHYMWMLWRPQYGVFGMIIFPYHLALLIILPWVFLAGLGFYTASTLLHPLFGLILIPIVIVAMKKDWRIFLGSYLMSEIALAVGLLLCTRRVPLIQRIDSTRKLGYQHS
jgi:cellulose synthase/poly-beta-1,6-N-acetylglucosamine synthase-like glycosyltransferase